MTPRRFDEIAVLFCDVVDFTSYCDQHTPENVVSHLQALVESFETLALNHGLEKIKTVGDAFLATAGMFRDVSDPVLASVRCGLDMIEATNELSSGWKVRVGIHFGPVVAGVVGQRQFGFDIWGDTVNIAARIVGEAEPGTVLVQRHRLAASARLLPRQIQRLRPAQGKRQRRAGRLRAAALAFDRSGP